MFSTLLIATFINRYKFSINRIGNFTLNTMVVLIFGSNIKKQYYFKKCMYDNLNEKTYYFLFLQYCRICPIRQFYCKRARQQFWAKLSYLPHTTILFITIACARKIRKINNVKLSYLPYTTILR